MPPQDPALGMTGTLNAIQTQLPLTNDSNLPPVNAAPGKETENLARAAKSLESVQGGVSGQTMAIQQMMMSGQQQTLNMQMLVEQLGLKINELSRSVSQMSTSMNMSNMQIGMAAPPPMAPPPPMPSYAPHTPVYQQVGSTLAAVGKPMLAAGGMALRSAHGFGSTIGGAVQPIANAFMGTPTFGPGAGQIGPRFSPQAGFWSGLGMASGLGIHPSMTQRADAAQIQQAGSELMQQRLADMMIGGTGAGTGLAIELGTDAALMQLATKGLGMGILGGGAFGLMAGVPITAAVGSGIQETMQQAANIRGFGEQYSRGAFRYMGPDGLGSRSLRRPSIAQRRRVGADINRMEIQDLVYDSNDMREIFAGIQQQDLMRGVSSADEVVARLRETKEVFKLIGSRLGQGIQEAASTAGTLQGLGFNVTGQRGRAALFGAGSISGLTPAEGVQKAAAFGGQFVEQGLGRGMMGIGAQSIQAAKYATRTGLLSNVDIASYGGPEGAELALGQFTERFLQSNLGKSMLMAGGADTAGLSLNEMYSTASARANNPNLLLSMARGGQAQKSKFLQDPRALSVMIQKVGQVANEIMANDPAISRDEAFRTALQNITGVSDAQSGALMNIMRGYPNSRMDQVRQQTVDLSGQFQNQALQERAVVPRAGRFLRGLATPFAEAAVSGAEGIAGSLARGATNIYEDLVGIETVDLGSQMDMGTMQSLRSRPKTVDLSWEAQQERRKRLFDDSYRGKQTRLQAQIRNPNLKVSEGNKKHARELINSVPNHLKKRAKELVEEIRSTPYDMRKHILAKEVLDIYSQGTYKRHTGKGSLGVRQAIQKAVEQETGLNLDSILSFKEGITPTFTEGEKEAYKETRRELASILGVNERDISAYTSQEAIDYMKAVKDVQMGGGQEAALLSTEGGKAVRDFIDQMFDEESGDFFGSAEDKVDDFVSLANKKNFLSMSKQMQAASRQKVITGGLARGLMETSGLTGDYGRMITGLGSEDYRRRRSAFGDLLGKVTSADISTLSKGQGTAGRFGRVLQAIRQVDMRDGLQGPEKDKLRSLFPGLSDQQADKLLTNVKSAADLEDLALKAMDLQSPYAIRTKAHGGSFTDAQSKQLSDLMAHNTQMALYMKDIAAEVSKWKPVK